MRATQAVIYLDHLRYNIRQIKSHLQGTKKICIAVKADGYGHGAVAVAKIAQQEGIDFLGVATLQEGIELREADINLPLLLLSLTIPEEIPDLIEYKIIPLIADGSQILLIAKEAEKQKTEAQVHLKIDTGMGRIGCRPGEAKLLAELIARQKYLKLGGVCTHFPAADTGDKSFSLNQLTQFNRAIVEIKKAGIDPGIIHAANSGAIIDLNDSYFDMIRPGIMVYGYYPSSEQKRIIPLKPVMELKTRIVFLKKVEPGTPISYGMTYTTSRRSTIATIPIGYGDGYNRLLSNKGEVLINGKRYPIAGRVCMDQSMVDLADDTTVNLYDEVIIFGPDKNGPDAEEISRLIKTIPYEVTCMVNKRVPRVYVE